MFLNQTYTLDTSVFIIVFLLVTFVKAENGHSIYVNNTIFVLSVFSLKRRTELSIQNTSVYFFQKNIPKNVLIFYATNFRVAVILMFYPYNF